MSTVQVVRPEPAGQTRGEGWTSTVRRYPFRAVLALIVLAGVAARLHSQSALWLDEALSVHIARLPLSQLPDALRADGSPPLYYLLLHGWIAVFGQSANAVRALSSLFALAALPLAYVIGKRLRDAATGRAALLLLAVCPFAVRYATEARMYALVVLLVLAGLLALLRAQERPDLPRLALLAVLAGLLALTHYWSLYLLAATGGLLLLRAVRGDGDRDSVRCLAALLCGGALFIPWLPAFLYQLRHTGTPWAPAPDLGAVLDTVRGWAGGRTASAGVLFVVLLALLLLGVLGRPWEGEHGHKGVVLHLPADRAAGYLLAVSAGTLTLGIGAGALLSMGYAPRYSSVALAPALLLAALGSRVLPTGARRAVLAVAAVTGLLGSLPIPLRHDRTQAASTARVLRHQVVPGDLVVYCPDQLGPAVSHLLPPDIDQVVYPSLAGPDRVDWRDYAQRQAVASPVVAAGLIDRRARGAVWLVTAGGYRTYGRQCEQLDEALYRLRGGRLLLQAARPGRYDEEQALLRYPGRTG
jgi:mannosyltransferase